jgi:hypothetical protein
MDAVSTHAYRVLIIRAGVGFFKRGEGSFWNAGVFVSICGAGAASEDRGAARSTDLPF